MQSHETPNPSEEQAEKRPFALLDVDGTILQMGKLLSAGGDIREILNLPLFQALKQQGIMDLYLFTNMDIKTLDSEYGVEGALLVKRHELVSYLQSEGFNVHGVVTPYDKNYDKGLGAYYKDVIDKHRQRIDDGMIVGTLLDDSEVKKDLKSQRILNEAKHEDLIKLDETLKEKNIIQKSDSLDVKAMMYSYVLQEKEAWHGDAYFADDQQNCISAIKAIDSLERLNPENNLPNLRILSIAGFNEPNDPFLSANREVVLASYNASLSEAGKKSDSSIQEKFNSNIEKQFNSACEDLEKICDANPSSPFYIVGKEILAHAKNVHLNGNLNTDEILLLTQFINKTKNVIKRPEYYNFSINSIPSLAKLEELATPTMTNETALLARKEFSQVIKKIVFEQACNKVEMAISSSNNPTSSSLITKLGKEILAEIKLAHNQGKLAPEEFSQLTNFINITADNVQNPNQKNIDAFAKFLDKITSLQQAPIQELVKKFQDATVKVNAFNLACNSLTNKNPSATTKGSAEMAHQDSESIKVLWQETNDFLAKAKAEKRNATIEELPALIQSVQEVEQTFEFKLACCKLEEATNINSDNDSYADLKVAGKEVLKQTRKAYEDGIVKSQDLPNLTGLITQTTNVVRDPNNINQFEDYARKTNDIVLNKTNWGKLIGGAACCVLGVAILAATVAAVVLTHGAATPIIPVGMTTGVGMIKKGVDLIKGSPGVSLAKTAGLGLFAKTAKKAVEKQKTEEKVSENTSSFVKK